MAEIKIEVEETKSWIMVQSDDGVNGYSVNLIHPYSDDDLIDALKWLSEILSKDA